jgi:phosphoribosyl 1,2-cyclic phosphate phosphodiesterase
MTMQAVSQLTFLGSSDSQGVPRWWCNCEVCLEARETKINARTRPSVMLELEGQKVLIDASPEFRLQATRENLFNLETVLITHAHNDHILGLGDVLDYLRWEGANTQIYAPESVIPQLEQRFNYAFKGRYSSRFHAFPKSLELHGWKVGTFEVPHGFNGTANAFKLERDGKTWVYCSDSIGLSDAILEQHFQNLELLILGTSFWDESSAVYSSRSVYDVLEALELVKKVKPVRTVFTHLGHGVDARDAHLLPENIMLARDGLKLELW